MSWVAAEYSEGLIRKWFEQREWEPIASSTLEYYRKQLAPEIEAARKERRDTAMSRGLALKEERIRRLAEHADELELIKWVKDKNGRLHNEKAWRETLNDLAAEMGHRRPGVDDVAEQATTVILERLRTKLEPNEFAAVVRALSESGRESGSQ